MYRLEVLGERYFSRDVRSTVFDYYVRMKSRTSMLKMVETNNQLASIMLKLSSKRYEKTALKVGLTCGLLHLVSWVTGDTVKPGTGWEGLDHFNL